MDSIRVRKNQLTFFALLILLLIFIVSGSARVHAAENLLQNPGFESDFAAWDDWGNSSITTGDAYSGVKAMQVGTGGGGRAQRVENLVPGVTYTMCAWSKLGSSSDGAYMGVNIYDASSTLIANHQWVVTWTSYEQRSVTFTVPGDVNFTNIWAWKDAGSTYLYVDDYLLVEGTTCEISGLPNSPTSLVAVAVSTSQIDLIWSDNAGNEDGYKIDRSPNGVDTWVEIAVLGPDVTTYSNRGLIENTTYYYRVYAFNSEGDSGFSNVDSATTTIPSGSAFPFPQHINYAPGSILPNHRSQSQMDDDVRAFYDSWKAGYLVSAGTTTGGDPLYRVTFRSGEPDQTVSEGQGFGMVIVPIMAGYDPQAQVIFDGLFEFSREHPSGTDSRLMDWKVPETGGDRSAFDGDAEIAFGLLLADAQWGSVGRINYAAEAMTVISGILQSTIGPSSRLPMLGDWVTPAGPTYNQYTPRSSDFMPVNFRAFGRLTGDPVWDVVVTNSQAVISSIQTNHSPVTGLLPDFIVNADGTPDPAPAGFLEGPNDGKYNYNAGRDPWRIGADALLNNDAVSMVQTQKIANWIENASGGNPSNIKAGYSLDGTAIGNYFTTFFVSPFGVAAMTVPGQQQFLNDIYDAVYSTYEDYYQDSVNLLSLLVMTGNYWDPAAVQDGAPTTPSALVATVNSNSQIDLQWSDNSDNEDGFRIQRSPDGSSNWTEIVDLVPGSIAYSDTALSAGTTYYYRVYAYNSDGDSSYSNTAQGITFTIPRTIEFAGRSWTVKASEGLVGPGPNYFSDRGQDVWVDSGDRLHLRLAYRDSKWYSSEVITNDPLGYGTYTFSLASRVDQLDENAVLGLFIWDDNAAQYNYREIDIEFAKWGDAGDPTNSQYVVQPWDTPGNMVRFTSNLESDFSTHAFTWRSNSIEFQSNQGIGVTLGDEIYSWTYTGADVPPEGPGNARINLWLYQGSAPSDGQEVEIIVEAFDFTPLGPPAEPANLTALTVGENQIDLTWIDNANNEDGFKIERSPDGSINWAEIMTVGAGVTTASDTGLPAGTTYYYRVLAYNLEGNSSYSNVANATTQNPGLGEHEIMSWVPPYAISQSQAMALADFPTCDPVDGLTRVGLQFWVPQTNGTIKYADHEWYTPTDADVTWWTNWGQANGIEILLTIYNNTGSWDWNLARSAFVNNRTTFVNALISEMDRLNLDGIDLDLEGIGNFESDRSAFDQFVHDLWVQLDARGKILTIDSFHYIWNAPNHNWWSDWLGEVDNIHAMGYEDLYEGGTSYHQYSYQQNASISAGYSADKVLMGMPTFLSSWGTSSGRGTSAQAHVQEVRHDLVAPTGIAIWDMQLENWQDSDLWCEIVGLKGTTSNNPPEFTSDPIVKTNATEGSPYTGTISGDAIDPDTGDSLTFSKVSGPAWLLLSSDGALSGTPGSSDSGLNSWMVQVADGHGGAGSTTLEITVDALPSFIDQVATSETPVDGSVTGTYVNTHENDGIVESITEETTGGKPSKRLSFLEHLWTFELQSGFAVTFYANVWAPPSADGDSFIFAYSTDGTVFTDMLTVEASGDGGEYQTVALPNDLSGTVYIRVVDSDRTGGNRTKDTVFVDHLFIRSDQAQPQPPSAPSGLSATAASSNQIDLSWTDNSDNELGFTIERSPDGINGWTQIGEGSQDVELFSDTGLSPETIYYYRVQAQNSAGTSAYSNTDQATTDEVSTLQMHVSALDGASEPGKKNRWNASVTITVVDTYGTPVAGAIVTGEWSNGATGTSTCTTGAGGQCTVSKNNIKNTVTSVAFTVTNVEQAAYVYDSGSSITFITINIP